MAAPAGAAVRVLGGDGLLGVAAGDLDIAGLGRLVDRDHFVVDTSRNGRGPDTMQQFAGAPYDQPASVISALAAEKLASSPPCSANGTRLYRPRLPRPAQDRTDPERQHGHVTRSARPGRHGYAYAMVYAWVVAVPEVLSFREFRAGLAGVLDRVRRSPDAAVFVGAHRRAEAVLVSVEQYEALQEASERQHAVAAALASVRAEGLEPGAEDLALFAEVAAGRLSTDELRERVLSRYRR